MHASRFPLQRPQSTHDHREALAAFVREHEPLIRARFRDALEGGAGGLFDSSDFFATVLRRVDAAASSPVTTRPAIDAVQPLLQRIMAEAIADYLRSEAAEPLLIGLGGAEPASDDTSDSTHRPSLSALLSRLSPTDQQIVRLRATGLRFAAIGEALGLSAAATRMRWHRLASRLRPQLPVGRV